MWWTATRRCPSGCSSAPVVDEDFTGGRRQDYELGARLLAAQIPWPITQSQADHHPTAGIVTTPGNAHAEGRYDALLVTKYPHVVSQRPLGRPAPGRRAAAKCCLGGLRRDGCVAVATRLEALGRRERGAASSVTRGRLTIGPAPSRGSPGLAAGPPPAAADGRRRVLPMDRVTGRWSLAMWVRGLVPTLPGLHVARIPGWRRGPNGMEDVVKRLTDAVLGPAGSSFRRGDAPTSLTPPRRLPTRGAPPKRRAGGARRRLRAATRADAHVAPRAPLYRSQEPVSIVGAAWPLVGHWCRSRS